MSGKINDTSIGNEGEWTLTGSGSVRKVTVDPDLGKKLYPYQRHAVEFIWKNCFSDFNDTEKGDQSRIGGCLLAHYMGLGKSLTTLTALHTALKCPSMVFQEPGKNKKNAKPLIHTVLLIATANILTNWENEVEKWTENLNISLDITNLGEIGIVSRPKYIKNWKRKGGIMLLSNDIFKRVAKEITSEGDYPHVLVLDEAHTMFKQPTSEIFKSLCGIQTKRRILLSGTPFQNNALEYYRMAEYMRPGVIGVKSEKEFDKTYRIPIESGLPSDALEEEKLESAELTLKIKDKLKPYVDRKDETVLQELELPPIYDVLLELQTSPVQDRLIMLDSTLKKRGEKSKDFWTYYHSVSPLLNHPGTLKQFRPNKDEKKDLKKGQNFAWKSVEQASDEWFMKSISSNDEFEKLQQARSSPKLIILAHIIAKALQTDKKLLIFSRSISTLDIIEWFLGQNDWKKDVESLRTFKETLGGWEKGKHFVRIDGETNSCLRGRLVDKFNNDSDTRAFLISTLAGGIGINLCAASVVVIVDNHFNPQVSHQCISRSHRLGQENPVYCFRLAMEGTLEKRIYNRSLNKEGVAAQVVDGKPFEQRFEKKELKDLQKFDMILTCTLCDKRRRWIEDVLPTAIDKWHCAKNTDPNFNSCKIPQQKNLEKKRRGTYPISDDNPILKHLHSVINKKTRKTPLVLDHMEVHVTKKRNLLPNEAIPNEVTHILEENTSVPFNSRTKKRKLLSSRDGEE